MTQSVITVSLAIIMSMVLLGCTTTKSSSCSQPARIGSITGLKPEKTEYYKKLHAACWPGVLKQINKAGIRNYSIYLKEIDGQQYLFSHFEYVGSDFKNDMANIGDDETTQKWWKETDPCQSPLPMAKAKGEIWDGMEQVFYTDGAIDVEPAQIRRIASVTGLKHEKEEHYRTLHATTWPGVLNVIKKANIRKYTIYLKDIGDKLYLFSYFEYVGKDFDADMAGIAKDPVTLRWWNQTDPCQIPLPDAQKKGEIWDGMEEVFHAD